MLKSLVVLNMENCKRLKSLPCRLETDSHQVLHLSGCLRVDHLPTALGRMKSLLELHIHGTAITRLPSALFSLTNLIQVSSFGQHWSRWWATISQPSCLPQSLVFSSLASLPLLRSLNLSFCNILQVPEDIGGLSCLEERNLNGNGFTSLPRNLSQLSRLRTLEINNCKKLEVIPKLPPSIVHCNILQVPHDIGGLSCLKELKLNGSSFTSLPENLNQLSNLRHLNLVSCKKLKVLPELPSSLYYLLVYNCPKLVRNPTVESQVPQQVDTCMTSHFSTDKLSSLFQHIAIRSNIFEFYNEPTYRYLENEMKMTLHGKRIPQWFQNQSMGSHVKVEIPPNWCYSVLFPNWYSVYMSW